MSSNHLRYVLFLCLSLVISTSILAADFAKDLTATTSDVQGVSGSEPAVIIEDNFSDSFDDEGIDLQENADPTTSEQFWMAYNIVTSSDLNAKEKYDLISVFAQGHFKKHPIVDSIVVAVVLAGTGISLKCLGSFIYKKCTKPEEKKP